MATYRLEASPKTVHWGFFDAKLPAQFTVNSGDTVVISTVSGSPGFLPKPGSGLTVPAELQAIHDSVQPKLGGPHTSRGRSPCGARRPGMCSRCASRRSS